MKKVLRCLVFILFALGMILHGIFEMREGHKFTWLLLLVLPLFAFHYTAPVLGAMLTKKTGSLSALALTQIGLLIFDATHSNIWAGPVKEAAVGSALAWIVVSGVSIAITLTIVAAGFICEEFQTKPNG